MKDILKLMIACAWRKNAHGPWYTHIHALRFILAIDDMLAARLCGRAFGDPFRQSKYMYNLRIAESLASNLRTATPFGSICRRPAALHRAAVAPCAAQPWLEGGQLNNHRYTVETWWLSGASTSPSRISAA